MNKLSTEKTMTSVEIAEVTGKRHDHVLRDISKLSDRYIEMSLPNIGEGTYCHKNTGDQKHKLYFLTKIQTLDLMTGYNVELRIKINRRWEELEKKNSLPDFNNPVLAARAWADEYEKKQMLQTRLDVVEPKAALADQALRDKTEHYSITDAGKHLGINQKLMFLILRDKGLLTKKNLPTQKALNYGVLLERTNSCDDGKNRKQAVMDMSCIFEFKKRYLTSQLELVKQSKVN